MDRSLLVTRDGLEPDTHLLVHLRVLPKPGSSILTCAHQLATLISLGNARALAHELPETRNALLAKIVGEPRGDAVTLAVPIEHFPSSVGVTQLISALTFPTEYDVASAYFIEDLTIPTGLLAAVSGPRLGVGGLRDRLGPKTAFPLGVILKPRLGVSLDTLLEIGELAVRGGADFIVDDELLVDPDGELGFENRVPSFADLAERLSTELGRPVTYVPSVVTSPARAIGLIEFGLRFGVFIYSCNPAVMGVGCIEDFVDVFDGKMGIIATNHGTAIATRGFETGRAKHSAGYSEGFVVKLTRLAGADAIHCGIADSSWFQPEVPASSLLAAQGELRGKRKSFVVAAGGLNILNIASNATSAGADMIFEAGTAILGNPSGPWAGAKVLRLGLDLVEEHGERYRESSEQLLQDLAKLASRREYRFLDETIAQLNWKETES